MLIIARNILLLTLLLDNNDPKDKSPPDYWSIFYDLYVDNKTLATIRKHARILFNTSKDMETWIGSPYDQVIRIINIETLSLLRECWLKYATYSDNDRSHTLRFRSQCRQSYDAVPPASTHYELQSLARSFGPRLLNAMLIVEYHVNHFWKVGTADRLGRLPELQCNPLAVYSASGNDRFSLHYLTNPLTGFHLGPAITSFDKDSLYGSLQGTPREKTLSVAKMQFRLWCNAFQNLAQKTIANKSKGGRIRIRFVVADAIQFCRGLNQLRTTHSSECNFYSRPWSTTVLRLDGPGFLNGLDKQPLSFNVIDAPLAEDVGYLNLLVAAAPLLEQSAVATLYTESNRMYPQPGVAPNLLTDLLGGDITTICALLGIVPGPYVSGASARATDEAYMDDHSPVFNRINWKVATSTDTHFNPAGLKLVFEPETLAKFLFDLYSDIFLYENLHKDRPKPHGGRGNLRSAPPRYSASSFAAFLAFLKTRWHVDPSFIDHFNELILHELRSLKEKNTAVDLFLQLDLFGISTKNPYQEAIEAVLTSSPDHVAHMRESPPKITGIVITVPRRKLRPLYKACVDNNHHLNMIFQVNFMAKTFSNTFSSIHPVFGQLSMAADSDVVNIERDPSGWFGSADLQLCLYVPTYVLAIADPKFVEISVTMIPDSTVRIFKEMLGPDLEVFRVNFMSSEFVHLVESLPGLQSPLLITTLSSDKSLSPLTQVSPVFDPFNKTFTTRIKFQEENHLEALGSGTPVTYNRTSACTIEIKCGEFKCLCRHPFPLRADVPRIRIARKSGWVEVIVQLLPPQVSGLSPKNFLPMVIDKKYGLTLWNVPYINFSQLPRIGANEYVEMVDAWLPNHLFSMYSAYEVPLLGPEQHGLLVEFKKSVLSLFEYMARSGGAEACVFTLAPKESILEGGGPMLFFSTGLYLDHNANTVIAEAYVVPMTTTQTLDPRFYPLMMKLAPTISTVVHQEVYMLWKRLLPSMAERCRDWEHTSTCEFSNGIPDTIDPDRSPLCSCGIGKVGKNFSQGVWKDAASFVTRIVISPLFAIPYLEISKAGPLCRANKDKEKEKEKSNAKSRSANNGRTEKSHSQPSMNHSDPAPSTAPTAAASPPASTAPDPMPPPISYKCNDCGKQGAKQCGACGAAFYCSRECQVRDWKKHKVVCYKLRPQGTIS